MTKLKAFYKKHETGIKIFLGLVIIALFATVLLYGTAEFSVNQ